MSSSFAGSSPEPPMQTSPSAIYVGCSLPWAFFCVRRAVITFSFGMASAEILNLQPKGGKAKPYQVKQVRTVVVRYKLAGSV